MLEHAAGARRAASSPAALGARYPGALPAFGRDGVLRLDRLPRGGHRLGCGGHRGLRESNEYAAKFVASTCCAIEQYFRQVEQAAADPELCRRDERRCKTPLISRNPLLTIADPAATDEQKATARKAFPGPRGSATRPAEACRQADAEAGRSTRLQLVHDRSAWEPHRRHFRSADGPQSRWKKPRRPSLFQRPGESVGRRRGEFPHAAAPEQHLSRPCFKARPPTPGRSPYRPRFSKTTPKLVFWGSWR